MKPRLLFYEDPYMKEAEAEVVKVEGRAVWLDRTIFFAESGGQESDRGWINGIAVVDVRPDDFAHILSEEPSFSAGERVTLKLDWDRRYRIMRLHTATHIVYFCAEEVLGGLNVIGSHVGPEKARLDIAFEGSVARYLPEIEERANAVIREGGEIVIYEREPGWRIWKLGSWEMPCSGTHVRRASEVGGVRLKRRNIGRGKERIEIYLLFP